MRGRRGRGSGRGRSDAHVRPGARPEDRSNWSGANMKVLNDFRLERGAGRLRAGTVKVTHKLDLSSYRIHCAYWKCTSTTHSGRTQTEPTRCVCLSRTDNHTSPLICVLPITWSSGKKAHLLTGIMSGHFPDRSPQITSH